MLLSNWRKLYGYTDRNGNFTPGYFQRKQIQIVDYFTSQNYLHMRTRNGTSAQKSVLVFLICLFLSLVYLNTVVVAPSKAGQEPYPATPSGVVKALSQILYQGRGLTSSTWKDLSKYTILDAGPAWDHLKIVKKFSVSTATRTGRKATVLVTYETIGIIDGSNQFTQNEVVEKVTYGLVKVNGLWKTTNLPDYPYVSLSATVNHLKQFSDPREPYSSWKALDRLRQLKNSANKQR